MSYSSELFLPSTPCCAGAGWFPMNLWKAGLSLPGFGGSSWRSPSLALPMEVVSAAHAGRCWVVFQHLPLTHGTEQSTRRIVPHAIRSKGPWQAQRLPELPHNPTGSLVTSTMCLETITAPCWGHQEQSQGRCTAQRVRPGKCQQFPLPPPK